MSHGSPQARLPSSAYATLSEARLAEIAAAPSSATLEEVTALCAEAQRWRPVSAFVHESLKAIFLSCKEEAQQSLLTKVCADIARSCMRRMKEAHLPKR
jgi:hypothetical protein